VRILIVNKYAYVTGGADRYCLALTELLRGAGHEVRWLSTASASNVEREGVFVPPRPSRAFWNGEAAGGIDRELRRFRPDLVHCHKLYPHLSVAPVVRAAHAGVPIVQTAHDYEFCSAERSGAPHKRVVDSLLFPLKRRLHVPRVARFVAPSEFVARTLRDAGIESTIVLHFVESQSSPPRAFQDRSGVVFAGRLVPEKGVDDVLRLAVSLPEVRITVAGSGPLEARVRAAPLRYLGQVEHGDLLEELGRARVAIVPSRWAEPAGLVALEAMASGTPVVAYETGGLAEYVSAADGVVVPGVDAMREAIAGLDDDAAGWQRRSTAGLEAVRSRFTPERHLAELESVYRSALGG
jgi:glycosyltransferase involved in cell wall biosynthesis